MYFLNLTNSREWFWNALSRNHKDLHSFEYAMSSASSSKTGDFSARMSKATTAFFRATRLANTPRSTCGETRNSKPASIKRTQKCSRKPERLSRNGWTIPKLSRVMFMAKERKKVRCHRLNGARKCLGQGWPRRYRQQDGGFAVNYQPAF